MMIRQPQPSEDTQTLLQTYRQDHPVVRRTDVQPRQWQNVQISSLGQLVHQLKQRQRVALRYLFRTLLRSLFSIPDAILRV